MDEKLEVDKRIKETLSGYGLSHIFKETPNSFRLVFIAGARWQIEKQTEQD